ncbi:hypothetical protein Tco_0485313 [Tanacetum coccineum]
MAPCYLQENVSQDLALLDQHLIKYISRIDCKTTFGLISEISLKKLFNSGQQHTKQPEIIVEGKVDQYPETCQVKSPMLDSSPDN